jgi:carbon monoxide dehydrogenase subunit G
VELTHSFTIDRPVDRTWTILTDLDRAALCLPGAALLGRPSDAGERPGAVVVKVGPISAQYEGVARLVERDDAGHRAVVRAEGRDVGGQGTATATIDLRLQPRGSGTLVTVDTDLAFTGSVARFGGGVVADVSGKLVREFARRLEAEIAPAAPVEPTETTPVAEGEPLDLGSAGTAPLTRLVRKQAVPALAAVLGLLVGWLLGRARTGTASHDIEKGN